LVHVAAFDLHPLQHDELLQYNIIILRDWMNLVPYLYLHEVQQPLNYFWNKLTLYLTDSTFFLRLPALIFTLLIPFPLYRLARISLNIDDALKSIVLVLLFGPTIVFSSSMRLYLPFIFFSIFAFYQFRKPDRRNLTFILSLLLLFFTHPFGSVLALILIFLSFVEGHGEKKL
jgi:hypothetical protein